MNYDFKIFNNRNELSEYFAEFLKSEVDASKDKYNLALSGGSTPKYIFKYLANNHKNSINWSKVNFFWGDERCVPPYDDESNYKMVYESLLSKVSILDENIFSIKGDVEPFIEAARYSNIISKILPKRNNLPQFDLVMLGLGEDGHTASIFPNQLSLLTSDKIYSTAIHPGSEQTRITITGNVISNARNIVFIVTGESKSNIVDSIFNNNFDAKKYPASFIKPLNGKLFWLLDKEAAALLRLN